MLILSKDHIYRMIKRKVQQYLTKPNHCIWPIRTHYTFLSTNEQFAPNEHDLDMVQWPSTITILYIWSLRCEDELQEQVPCVIDTSWSDSYKIIQGDPRQLNTGLNKFEARCWTVGLEHMLIISSKQDTATLRCCQLKKLIVGPATLIFSQKNIAHHHQTQF